MLIDVRTDGNINGGEQLSNDVKSSVHVVLRRYEDRVRRIDVHLSDQVGHKASHDDKSCTIEVHRDAANSSSLRTRTASWSRLFVAQFIS
jgi:hypothetical protein